MQLDESIRAELEVTCSTHPDNPFPVSNEVTTRTDSRHYDSPAERRPFKDVAGVSGNRCIKHNSSVSNEVTTRTDSRHFDSPVERRLFEDIAGVSGNRCIKHGSSSTVVNWQMTVGVVFQDPDISKNIFPFPGVACNKRHTQPVPSTVGNGQSEFGGDSIRRSGDIRTRVQLAGNVGVVEEVRTTTTVSLSTLINSACTSQIRPRSDSPSLRNAPTDEHTHTHTHTHTHIYIYIYIYVDR